MEAMTAEQAAEVGKDLDFAKVWAALMKFDEQQRRTDEQQRRTDEQIAKTSKEVAELSISGRRTDEQQRRTDEQIARMSKEVAELSISGRRTDEQQRRTDEQIAKTSKEVAELSISGRRTDEQQRRTDEQIAKTSKEVAELSISRRRTDEQIAKTSKEVAELSKNIGGVNRSLGRWTEQMVAAKLWEKFDAFEYEFTRGSRNIKFRDGKQIIAEADIFLENGDYAMPVEVKTDLIEEDIDDHLDRIGKIRLHMDKRGDKRRLVGAVAGAIVPESVCRYAQKKGLYVVIQSGDSVEVAGIPNGFEARKW